MSINLTDIAVLNIEGSNCSLVISLISENEITKLFKNADLTDKS